jgi:ABC-type multidrug transport system fused ATPase/permease subunit
VLTTLYRILTFRERLAAGLTLVLVCLQAGIELVGLGAIFWFMRALVDPALLDAPWARWAYETGGFRDLTQFTFWLGVSVIGFIVFRNVFAVTTLYVELRLTATISAGLSERLLANYLGRPYPWFLSQNSAVLTRNIAEEVPKLVSGLILPCLRIATDGVIVLAVATMLVVYDPAMTIVVATAIACFAGIHALLGERLQKLGKRRLAGHEARFRTANESLAGVKEIRLLGREAAFTKAFAADAYPVARLDARAHLTKQIPRYLLEIIGFTTLIGVALYALASGASSYELVSVLTLYGVAGIRLLPSASKIFEAASNVRYSRAILDLLKGDLIRRPASTPPPPKPIAFARSIDLVDVRFRHEGRDTEVVRGISLSVPFHKSVGFVGTTGAGKTTIVDIMMGLLPPTSGQVLVDGRPLTEGNVRAWQASIGHVPQQVFLLDRSIRENIAVSVGGADIDDAAVRDAARLARLDEFIERELPQGYDTVIGDRGVRLSGGQRQRIGIARALYRRPALLVLDEATSELDNVTEAEIGQAIAKLGDVATVVVIAHRLSTVRQCDKVFFLRDGGIAAAGTYDELLAGDSGFQQFAVRGAA